MPNSTNNRYTTFSIRWRHFDIEVEVHVPGFLRLSKGARAVGELEKRVCKL